jgi:hypothetical protein
MDHSEATRQDKAKQKWKIKTNGEQNTELMGHSTTNCLLQLYTQVF